jgi:hypothetical protein
MDALRNSKKISFLAVAILFLFAFFNLILDAPRTFSLIPEPRRYVMIGLLSLSILLQIVASCLLVAERMTSKYD